MAAPPFEAGAVKLTVACPWPAVAETLVGAPGAVAGVPPPSPQADKTKRPMQPNALRILPRMNIPTPCDLIEFYRSYATNQAIATLPG